MTEPRSTAQRRADVLAALESNGQAWLATADDGRPHVIAVSAWWDGERLTLATLGASATARNLDASGRARLALGTPADAIVIEARVESSAPAEGAEAELSDGFSRALGWDPTEVGPGWRYFRLRPVRVQAFRGYDEIEGRDVMTGGRWLA